MRPSLRFSWRQQAGGILPMVACTLLLMGVLALGGFHLARLVIARQDAQRVADSYALSVAETYRARGSSVGDAEALRVSQKNVAPTRADRVINSPQGVLQSPPRGGTTGAISIKTKHQFAH